MNLFELFKTLADTVKSGLELAHKNQDSIDRHHFMVLKGQMFTMEGYVEELNEENIELKANEVRKDGLISAQKIEIETLKKMIRDGENK